MLHTTVEINLVNKMVKEKSGTKSTHRDSICTKFKNKPNPCMVLEVRGVVILRVVVRRA